MNMKSNREKYILENNFHKNRYMLIKQNESLNVLLV